MSTFSLSKGPRIFLALLIGALVTLGVYTYFFIAPGSNHASIGLMGGISVGLIFVITAPIRKYGQSVEQAKKKFQHVGLGIQIADELRRMEYSPEQALYILVQLGFAFKIVDKENYKELFVSNQPIPNWFKRVTAFSFFMVKAQSMSLWSVRKVPSDSDW